MKRVGCSRGNLKGHGMCTVCHSPRHPTRETTFLQQTGCSCTMFHDHCELIDEHYHCGRRLHVVHPVHRYPLHYITGGMGCATTPNLHQIQRVKAPCVCGPKLHIAPLKHHCRPIAGGVCEHPVIVEKYGKLVAFEGCNCVH